MSPLAFGRSLLTGVAQIWLQPSPWTGLLFLASLAVISWPLALGTLIGVLVGNLFGLVLRVPKEEIEAGLMGFSPALVGAGVWFFLDVTWRTAVILVVAAALAAALSIVMKRLLTVPAYTSPFIVMLWLVLYLAIRWNEPAAVLFWFDDPFHFPPLDAIGQVIFAGSALAGVLVLIGLAIARWQYAVAAAVAALAAWGLTVGLDAIVVGGLDFGQATRAAVGEGGDGTVAIGLFGFNAALTAVGLLATGRSKVVAGVGALFAFAIHGWIAFIGLLPLTAPFVLVMWTFDLIEQKRQKAQVS